MKITCQQNQIYWFIHLFNVLSIKPRISCMLDKSFNTDLNPQLPKIDFLNLLNAKIKQSNDEIDTRQL